MSERIDSPNNIEVCKKAAQSKYSCETRKISIACVQNKWVIQDWAESTRKQFEPNENIEGSWNDVERNAEFFAKLHKDCNQAG